MSLVIPARDRAMVEQLNRECFCITLDRPSLHEALRRETDDPEFVASYIASRPHLFSNAPVFLSRTEFTAMAEIVEAIEAAALSPGYQAAVLAFAPEIARHDFGPAGAFMGYDFHLGDDGPKLIEVNTNAGGAFLNGVGFEPRPGTTIPHLVFFAFQATNEEVKRIAMFGEDDELALPPVCIVHFGGVLKKL